MPARLQIGAVARATGLSPDAIRFYEKQRLLDPPLRSEGGFRIFHATDLRRLQFIRSAQQIGFSLPEIRELLTLQRSRGDACTRVRELLRTKIAAVRENLRALRAAERGLVRDLERCERQGRTDECDLLDQVPSRKDTHDHRTPVLRRLPPLSIRARSAAPGNGGREARRAP